MSISNQIASGVEFRDHQLHAAYFQYEEAFDIDSLLFAIEDFYPNYDWTPCVEAMKKEAEILGVEFDHLSDAQIKQIAADVSEFLAIENEVMELAA